MDTSKYGPFQIWTFPNTDTSKYRHFPAFLNAHISEYTGQRQSLQQPKPPNPARWATAPSPNHFLLQERRKGRLGRFPLELPTPHLAAVSSEINNQWRVKSWALQHIPGPDYLSDDVGSRIMSGKVDRPQIYLSKSNTGCLAKLGELALISPSLQ